MAHKKAGGSSRNGRDSQGQRLGVKRFGGPGDPKFILTDEKPRPDAAPRSRSSSTGAILMASGRVPKTLITRIFDID